MLEPDDIIPSFLDELEKIAAATSLTKKKGLGRIKELLTGSRQKALDSRHVHLIQRDNLVGDKGMKAMRTAGEAPVPTDKTRVEQIQKARRRAAEARHNSNRAIGEVSNEHWKEIRQVAGARVLAGIGGYATGTAGLIGGAAAVGSHLDKKDKEREEEEKHKQMLKKTAASFGRSLIAKSREGRRPISVAKFLKRDKEGTLFRKLHKEAETYQLYTQPKATVEDPRPRKKNELPTRVDVGDSPARVVGT